MLLTVEHAATRLEGPLLFLRRTIDAGLGDAVEVHAPAGPPRLGRVAALDAKLMTIEVLESTSGLDLPRQALYAAASRYAARFCSRLEMALGSGRPTLRVAAVAALRRFYRLGSTRKLQHIDSMTDRTLAAAI